MLFYYDDPHTIYDHWPKEVWAAVDAHQVKPGMSELETRMSIGRKLHTDSSEKGNRAVTYARTAKHWTVTYVETNDGNQKRVASTQIRWQGQSVKPAMRCQNIYQCREYFIRYQMISPAKNICLT